MAFPEEVIKAAWSRSKSEWNRTAGRCERCRKTLSWKNRGIKGAWGAWEFSPKKTDELHDAAKHSDCEILCLNCHTQKLTPQTPFTDLIARVDQAKKDCGKIAENLFHEGKNTVEIRKILELDDLPFELFLEVLGFRSIKEWKRAKSRIQRKQRATDKEGRTWRRQREKCLKRDSYRCFVCGKEASDVHHITPFITSHSHALDNLVALCSSHHDAINSNLSMYQKKNLQLVQEYIKTVNQKTGRNLVLAQAFTSQAGTIYYCIKET